LKGYLLGCQLADLKFIHLAINYWQQEVITMMGEEERRLMVSLLKF
jgi:hypothetical protein